MLMGDSFCLAVKSSATPDEAKDLTLDATHIRKCDLLFLRQNVELTMRTFQKNRSRCPRHSPGQVIPRVTAAACLKENVLKSSYRKSLRFHSEIQKKFTTFYLAET